MESNEHKTDLIPDKIIDYLPKVGETEKLNMEEIKVPLKLFNPAGSQTWYIYEYTPEKDLAYGLVDFGNPKEAELGHIDIKEIKNIELPFGLGIQRDIKWNPDISLRELIVTIKSGEHI